MKHVGFHLNLQGLMHRVCTMEASLQSDLLDTTIYQIQKLVAGFIRPKHKNYIAFWPYGAP